MSTLNGAGIVDAFWAAVWQGKDFDAIDRFCVDDFIITSGGIDVVSRDKFKAWAKQFNHLVNGLEFEVIETFQNGDGSRVASRWRVNGLNNGIFGLPADQREISFTGTAIWEIREDGKLVHNWVERAGWEVYSALRVGFIR